MSLWLYSVSLWLSILYIIFQIPQPPKRIFSFSHIQSEKETPLFESWPKLGQHFCHFILLFLFSSYSHSDLIWSGEDALKYFFKELNRPNFQVIIIMCKQLVS